MLKGIPVNYVLMEIDRSARGQMATRLLEAADALDLPRSVVRSKSKGYQVPEELHRYLFPSQYDDDAPEPPPVSDPAADFGGLTEDELEALTNPDKG